MNTEITDASQDNHVALIHKAEVDIQISTAKAFPRSMDKFIKDAMSMVSISPEIAEQCTYKLPRGGKSLEGPTVRLAEIILACYGNISAGARIVANDGKKITAEGVCIDAERNVRITKEVQVRITKKDGSTYDDDMQIVAGNAACAKAIRNAIFTVVPTAFVSHVREHAKKVARGDAKTLGVRVEAAITWYKDNGATEAQICEALGIRNVKDITLDHLEDLTGWKVSAQEGEKGTLKSRLQDILKSASGKSEPDSTELMEILAANEASFGPEEYKTLRNIVTSNEVKSFAKVQARINEVIAQ